jgi:hypothetical protein
MPLEYSAARFVERLEAHRSQEKQQEYQRRHCPGSRIIENNIAISNPCPVLSFPFVILVEAEHQAQKSEASNQGDVPHQLM